MAKQRLSTVNFGLTKGGLATVGYTLYNTNSTVYAARSTSGVNEFGTSTGVYGALITIPDDRAVMVMWDTGDASVRYGSEDNNVQLDSIQQETDHIRLIWNSIRNQGALVNSIMDKLGLIEKNRGLVKQDIKEVLDGIKFPEREIKIPPFPAFPDIPDYSKNLSSIESLIKGVSSQVNDFTKYDKNFSSLNFVINAASKNISDAIKNGEVLDKQRAGLMIHELKRIQGLFSKFDSILEKINKLNDKLSENDKSLKGSEKVIYDEIRKLKNLLTNTISLVDNSPQLRESGDLLRTFGVPK